MRSNQKRAINLNEYKNEHLVQKLKSIEDKQALSIIIDRVNESLLNLSHEKIERANFERLKPKIINILQNENLSLPGINPVELSTIILESLSGYGIIHQLIANPEIKSVIIQNYKQIYINKKHQWEQININFGSASSLTSFAQRIANDFGLKFNEDNPIQYIDDEKMHVQIWLTGFGASPDSTRIFIQKVQKNPYNVEELRYAMSNSIEDFLKFCVKSKFNIGVIGDFNSGKTTMLQQLTKWLRPDIHVALLQFSNEIQSFPPFTTRLSLPSLLNSQIEITKLIKEIKVQTLVLGELRQETMSMLTYFMKRGGQCFYTYASHDIDGLIDDLYNHKLIDGAYRSNDKKITKEIGKYNDIIIVMDRLRIREVYQVTGEIYDEMPKYERLFYFDIKNESHFEITGEWKKETGKILCEKLKNKAELNGNAAPYSIS